MPDALNPIPNNDTRKEMARRVREEALTLSDMRVGSVTQQNNAAASIALDQPGDQVAAHDTFTKGLGHDMYGRVAKADLQSLISAINQDANGAKYNESPFPGVYEGAGKGKPAKFNAPLYKGGYSRPAGMKVRGWESPIAGHTFDLEGADPDQLAMPPAPAIGSAEMTAEMAEVYAAALIRDLPFDAWEGITKDSVIDTSSRDSIKTQQSALRDVLGALNALSFFSSVPNANALSEKHRKARFRDGTMLDGNNLFRGSTAGAHKGPYISQFMYLGNEAQSSGDLAATPAANSAKLSQDGLTRARSFGALSMAATALGDSGAEAQIETTVTEGIIRYGTQGIPQSFPPHRPDVDHMVEWETWLDVQNGANRKESLDVFLEENNAPKARFISSPRDLATYVHFDALYQAYLNACLLLLGTQAGTDVGFPEGGGGDAKERDAFATFGGPHILTLVCEVATRALKAVRRQKYNVHLRSRPEVVGAAVALAWTKDDDVLEALGHQRDDLVDTADEMEGANGLLSQVAAHNKKALAVWTAKGWGEDHGPLGSEDFNALLPMAFPEGSPMHPCYGAGHATVAGACVTILKAFFEMYEPAEQRGFSIYDVLGVGDDKNLYNNTFPAGLFGDEAPLTVTHAKFVGLSQEERDKIPFATAVLPDESTGYTSLRPVSAHLSIQQELDKLAANISIGRNFAGVHFYTDYYESLRMGERIAVSILQEQMLTYREPVSMRFTSFDDDRVMIVGTGGTKDQDDAAVLVWDENGNGGTKADFANWWSRHTS